MTRRKVYGIQRRLLNTLPHVKKSGRPVKKSGRSVKKSMKKKNGGGDFGPASFTPEFGGAYYSLNAYKESMFPQSDRQHGGGGNKSITRQKKRTRKNQ